MLVAFKQDIKEALEPVVVKYTENVPSAQITRILPPLIDKAVRILNKCLQEIRLYHASLSLDDRTRFIHTKTLAYSFAFNPNCSSYTARAVEAIQKAFIKVFKDQFEIA